MEGSNPTRLIFFHEGDIFKYHYCLNKTFLSYFCYILNVFTIVFFECFLCVCPKTRASKYKITLLIAYFGYIAFFVTPI